MVITVGDWNTSLIESIKFHEERMTYIFRANHVTIGIAALILYSQLL